MLRQRYGYYMNLNVSRDSDGSVSTGQGVKTKPIIRCNAHACKANSRIHTRAHAHTHTHARASMYYYAECADDRASRVWFISNLICISQPRHDMVTANVIAFIARARGIAAKTVRIWFGWVSASAQTHPQQQRISVRNTHTHTCDICALIHNIILNNAHQVWRPRAAVYTTHSARILEHTHVELCSQAQQTHTHTHTSQHQSAHTHASKYLSSITPKECERAGERV